MGLDERTEHNGRRMISSWGGSGADICMTTMRNTGASVVRMHALHPPVAHTRMHNVPRAIKPEKIHLT
jgi:hypothetical protein